MQNPIYPNFEIEDMELTGLPQGLDADTMVVAVLRKK